MTELTESQRIEICNHIVPMIRSGLPIDRGLKAITAELPKRIVAVSSRIQSQLQLGEPLSEVLGTGKRPESRSLNATIAAGESARDLAMALESWAEVQTAHAAATKRFRLRMIYPVFLILISICAVGWSMHVVIPQYKASLESIHSTLPAWFYPIEFIHQNIVAWGILAATLCIAPLFYFSWKRNSYDSNGWPRDPARRSHLQAHAALLSEKMTQAELPLDRIESLAVSALGSTNGNQNLDAACKSILDLMRAGQLDSVKSASMLADVSKYLKTNSAAQVESQGRWLTYAISICVAVVVGLSYLLIIYLPWLFLLEELRHMKYVD